VHKLRLYSFEVVAFDGQTFMKMLRTRLNWREACKRLHFGQLGNGPLSPLFLFLCKTNTPHGYFSPICVQLWGPGKDIQKPKSYKAEFSLAKNKDDKDAAALFPVSY